MAGSDATAVTVGPKQAAAELGLSERGLRQAIEARLVPASTVARGGSFSYRLELDELRQALAALERCRMPGCNGAALCENGGCGARGHGRIGRTRSPEVGKNISRAKKGRAQVARRPSQITLEQAITETGFSRKVLYEGAIDGRLRHRRASRPGRQPDGFLFDRDELLGDVAKQRCSYPGCEELAPGRSGRCGEHAAGVKYETVELVCRYSKCGKTFTRPGSWLRENPDSRGHFCSNECKGLAHAEQNPGRLPRLNPDGARDHHAEIAEQIVAEGLLDRIRAPAAHPYHYSASSMIAAALSGELRSELRQYRGSLRRVYVPADVGAWEPPWAGDLDRRASVAKGTHGIAAARRIWGRAAPTRAAQHGTKPGPKTRLSDDQEKQVRWLLGRGYSQRRVAQTVGCSRKQVRQRSWPTGRGSGRVRAHVIVP